MAQRRCFHPWSWSSLITAFNLTSKWDAAGAGVDSHLYSSWGVPAFSEWSDLSFCVWNLLTVSVGWSEQLRSAPVISDIITFIHNFFPLGMRAATTITSKPDVEMSLQRAVKLICWQFWISKFFFFLLTFNSYVHTRQLDPSSAHESTITTDDAPELIYRYSDSASRAQKKMEWTGNCASGSKPTGPGQGERSRALQLTSLPSQHIPGQALFLNTSSPRSVSHRGQVDKSLWASRASQWP